MSRIKWEPMRADEEWERGYAVRPIEPTGWWLWLPLHKGSGSFLVRSRENGQWTTKHIKSRGVVCGPGNEKRRLFKHEKELVVRYMLMEASGDAS